MMALSSRQFQHPFRHFLVGLVLAGMTWACGTGENGSEEMDPEKLADPALFLEGDSFPAASLPPAVSEWLSGYAKLDTGIRVHNLKSSGVTLHIGPLGPASIPNNGHVQAIPPYLVYSPDSSRAIDFNSYGAFPDTAKTGEITWLGGDADQEVALVMILQGKRLQLMYNGPQTTVEAAGWVTNDACLLGLIQRDEASQRFYPELMLFNFRDSLFTNFRTSDDFPLDLLKQEPGNFPDDNKITK